MSWKVKVAIFVSTNLTNEAVAGLLDSVA